MATATLRSVEIRQIKEFTYLWEGVDRNNRSVRGETKARVGNGRQLQSAAPGHPRSPSSGAQIFPRRQPGHRDATSRSSRASSPRCLEAGVPLLQAFEIVARGHRNAALLPPDDGHQEPRRGGVKPFRRPSASIRGSSTRSTATWSARARPPATLDAILGSARHLQGEDSRDQEQDQVCALLSDLGRCRWRSSSSSGDHGLGDSVVQASVFANFGANLPAPDADGDRPYRTSSWPIGG